MQFQLIGTNFLAFVVWSVNLSSLICKLWSYFGHFEICGQCLNGTGYLALCYIENSTSTGGHFLDTLCGSINCMSWMILNYEAYFRHFQKLKAFLYLRPFNLFSFKKSYILPIEYVFSFFRSVKCLSLVCKLYISIRTVLLDFLSSVDIGGFL